MSIPSVVTGIIVKNLDINNSFKISWNAVTPTVSPTLNYYSIYRSEANFTGYNIVSTVSATVLQYIDLTIPYTFDKPWYYKVTATNSDGSSDINSTQGMTDFDYLVFQRTPVELDYLANLVTWIENETPTGAVNGSNNNFYTLYNYRPQTLQVYENGKKLLASEFNQITPNSFSLSVTPTLALSVNYIKL